MAETTTKKPRKKTITVMGATVHVDTAAIEQRANEDGAMQLMLLSGDNELAGPALVQLLMAGIDREEFLQAMDDLRGEDKYASVEKVDKFLEGVMTAVNALKN